jgi:NADPH2:quinone reductase
MKAVRVHQPGGAEALTYETVDQPELKPGDVLVRIEAIGVNFIDVYHRGGLYPIPTPFILGNEAAGVVEQLGEGVTGWQPGDRVAYTGIMGSYAEYAVVPAARLVPVPSGITSNQAAAAMLQGMTAHYLLYSTYPVRAGETILVHAAAGGVGLLLVQMAHQLGARVIGTVSTEAKAQLAREAGADEVVLYTEQDFEAEVKRITHDQGVHVVYDSVGVTTFDKSLNCLRPRGYLVLFGQSSGPVPPVNPQVLNQKGSLFLTRPTLWHYVATRDELLDRAGAVLGAINAGTLHIRIDSEYSLAEAAAAHNRLESRGSTGKILLLP